MIKSCNHPCCENGICRREKKEKKRLPLKRVSDKTKTNMNAYSKQKKAFMEVHPICQAQIEGICQHQATDIHHAKGREGALLLNEEYWVAICRACHRWTHDNDQKARQLGLLISKFKK